MLERVLRPEITSQSQNTLSCLLILLIISIVFKRFHKTLDLETKIKARLLYSSRGVGGGLHEGVPALGNGCLWKPKFYFKYLNLLYLLDSNGGSAINIDAGLREIMNSLLHASNGELIQLPDDVIHNIIRMLSNRLQVISKYASKPTKRTTTFFRDDVNVFP